MIVYDRLEHAETAAAWANVFILESSCLARFTIKSILTVPFLHPFSTSQDRQNIVFFLYRKIIYILSIVLPSLLIRFILILSSGRLQTNCLKLLARAYGFSRIPLQTQFLLPPLCRLFCTISLLL